MAHKSHIAERLDLTAPLMGNGAADYESHAGVESPRTVEDRPPDATTPPITDPNDSQALSPSRLAWRRRVISRVSLWCSLVAATIGAVTIVGWLSGWESLASLRTRYIPMAPSTALCFALLGFAAIAHARGRLLRVAAGISATVVALVATAKIIESLSGYRFGIDELLIADPPMFGVVRKGRMAPLTAVEFLIAALAQVCLLRAAWRGLAGFVATCVTAISIAILLGYMHGTPLLYGGSVIPVALPTAAAFFFIGVALITASGPEHWPLRPLLGSSTRSLLLRWFLPVVIAGTLVNSYLQSRFIDRPSLNPALVSALSTLGFAFLISTLISQVARIVGGRIDRAEAGRNRAQTELKELNADLERRIAARTNELRLKNEETQRLLADLTQSHEQLKCAQLELIQAEKMQSVGSLAAGIAHEVKNPLAILEMGVACLAKQPELDADSRDLVHREMKDAVARANTVISGLLNYAASKELDIRECDLHAILDRSLHFVRHEFVNRRITVARDLAGDLPRCPIDAQKIEQVFVNLFTNASHAMPNGGTLTVSTSMRTLSAADARWEAGDRSGCRFHEGERVAVVTVRDTGDGISPDQLGKLFDPFFTTKPTGQGLGLGLTVARKIIDLHGGRLELANAPQGGGALATVTFQLP